MYWPPRKRSPNKCRATKFRGARQKITSTLQWTLHVPQLSNSFRRHCKATNYGRDARFAVCTRYSIGILADACSFFTGYAEVQHFWDKARQKPRETHAQRRQPWSFETVGNVHTTSAYSAYCASVHRPPMNSRYVRGGVSLLQMTDWQLSCEAVVSDAVIPCNLLQRAFDNVLLT